MSQFIIHRYWSGPSSDLNGWTEQLVRSLHPYAEIRLWGPGDWAVDKDQVKPEDQVRHESNVARYKSLLEFGGLWLDHDVVPLCDLFKATTNNWTAGLMRVREGCAMRFEAHHPFLLELLDRVENLPESNNRSVDVSGAGMLNRMRTPLSIESRIIPADACGRWIANEPPIAVHLWETSRKRFNNVD